MQTLYKLFILISLTTISFSQTYKLSGDQLFDLAAESVVFIAVNDGSGGFAYGSGVIVTDEGHIITNYHVVEGSKSEELLVFVYEGIHIFDKLIENGNYKTVKILATDKSKDLALLKINEQIDKINPIYLAYDEDISIGTQVFAIGHPVDGYNPLLWSFTEGIVNRIAYNEWSYDSQSIPSGFFDNIYNWWFDIEEDDSYYAIGANTIFTQTPINGGNSGGLLMDSSGHLVGINTYTNPQMMNVSGAVAVDEVINFLKNNDIEVIDDTEYASSELVYNFETFNIRESGDEGFSYNTTFENNEILIEFTFSGDDQDADYIGIDLNNDDYYDIILNDVDDDELFSYWQIDLDMNGDFEWEGDRFVDKKTRYYRKFISKIDAMLNASFNELDRLGLIE